MKETVIQLREIRSQLENQGRAIVNNTKSSRATSLVATSLEKSRMWLGKCIGAIGLNRSPYHKVSDFNVYIPATADVENYTLTGYQKIYENDLYNQVVMLNQKRTTLKNIINLLAGELSIYVKANANRQAGSYLDLAIQELELATMYIGVKLSEIRDAVQVEVKNDNFENIAIINNEIANKAEEDYWFTTVQKEESKKDFEAEMVNLDAQPNPNTPDPQHGKVLEEFKKDVTVNTSENPTFQTENFATNEGQPEEQDALYDKKPVAESDLEKPLTIEGNNPEVNNSEIPGNSEAPTL